MERIRHDLIVVGGGSAGHAAATTAAGLGLRCALVDSAGELGGLCILRGCMPSKALIETANRMRIIRGAEEFAIRVSPPRVDVQRLRDRVRGLVAGFREDRLEDMRSGEYELIRGRCRFVARNAVTIEPSEGGPERVMEAPSFVIATGSEPFVPEIPGLVKGSYWTSDDVVRLPRVPEHLVVVGSGPIGMECAHLFEGLGSRVTVLVRSDRILSDFDPDVSTAIEKESRGRGIALLKKTSLSQVENGGGRFVVQTDAGTRIGCDALLMASGRKPRTKGLGLEVLGLEMEGGRIRIDEHARTSVPHVFAAGDCASPVPVVHLAVIQGEIAARNAAARFLNRPELESAWNPDDAMVALFTEPQVLRIGVDVKTAAEKGLDPVCGRADYADHGKGRIVGSGHGFVKIVASRGDRRLIGATAVGPLVAETGHLPAFAIAAGLRVSDYLKLPHYHPTLAEAWSRAVEQVRAQL